MRTIRTFTSFTRTVTVAYNSELNEYRVRLSESGKPQPDADYFTDDKQDAFQTARLMQMMGATH